MDRGISLVVLLSSVMVGCSVAEVNMLTITEQTELLRQKEEECYRHIITDPKPTGLGALYCNRTWDGAVCWADSSPGADAVTACPDYIHGFDTDGEVSRFCNEFGEWGGGVNGTPWTNFSYCTSEQMNTGQEVFATVHPLMEQHIPSLQIMYNTGYCVSLVLLLVALSIMISMKKLHCARNYIHMNLFASFILRGLLNVLKDNLMVDGLGFPHDIKEHPVMKGFHIWDESVPHWGCKVFFSFMSYAILLNYTWIFLEGLYLHNLIFVRVFSETSGVEWYTMAGWLFPLIPLTPWIIVRIFWDDHLCWNVSRTKSIWIIRGTIIALLLVNAVFFFNVLRVLFTKLSTSYAANGKRYRKLARSTLVLIPLFGIYYVVTIFFPDDVPPKAQLFQLYFELFFTSWSGALVAVLFCFLNGEVRAEVRKKWQRYQLRREKGGGAPLRRLSRGGSSFTMATNFSTSRKGSNAHSVNIADLKNGNTASSSHKFGKSKTKDPNRDSYGSTPPRDQILDGARMPLVQNSISIPDTNQSASRPQRRLSLPRNVSVIDEEGEPMMSPAIRKDSDAIAPGTDQYEDITQLTLV